MAARGLRRAERSSEEAAQGLTTLAALGLIALTAVLDVLTSQDVVLLGLSILGPLVASLRASAAQTGAVAVVALITAAALGVVDGMMFTVDHTIRVLIVALAGAVSVFAAAQRQQRVEALARLSHLVEVAQEVMLRPPPRELAGIRLAARYQSASADSRIGGDLYETAFTATGVRVVMGDVRGKGLEAVRLAATVLATFREAVWDGDLLALAKLMDERVGAQSRDAEDFVTMVLVEFLHDGGLTVVNCGHHAPIRIHGGVATRLEPSEEAPPLGLFPQPSLDRFAFDVGDRLLLCTDGLVEARDAAGHFFPLDRHILELAEGDVEDAMDALVRRILQHVPGELTDDIAIMLAERCSADPPDAPVLQP